MSIVTKTGDTGSTSLFGGRRVSKDSPRIAAYGSVDELNAILGIVLAQGNLTEERQAQIRELQNFLFVVAGDLATPLDIPSKQTRIAAHHIDCIGEWITALEALLPAQKSFIVPGGTVGASYLHLARTVCRRAEREVVSLSHGEAVNPCVQRLLNRLSDYFFILARTANADAGVSDTEVRYEAS